MKIRVTILNNTKRDFLNKLNNLFKLNKNENTMKSFKVCFKRPIILTMVILVSFNFCKKEDDQDADKNTVTDIEGNVYKTVKIGNQWWMAENLKTTLYNDGTPIILIEDSAIWRNYETPGYCWYNNDISISNDYGAIYNRLSVETGKLCPTGWHIPNTPEWQILEEFLGGRLIAGGKLKEAGTTHWESPNTNATNESGFTALPGGLRYFGSQFFYFGTAGHWWSSSRTEDDNTPSYFALYHDIGDSYILKALDAYGLSVRCIKD